VDAPDITTSPTDAIDGGALSRELESWRHLQSDNIEFTMKRLREPIEDGGERNGG
jgi:hypothetical protein